LIQLLRRFEPGTIVVINQRMTWVPLKMKISAIAILFFAFLPLTVYADAMDRMAIERLRATHKQVEAYTAKLKPVKLKSGYQDIRAILHAHSYLSHDSVGTIQEIVEAAHATDVKVIMFSNHPSETYDYFADGEQGLHDGVLLVPGAETGGMLVYPTRSMKDHASTTPQPLVDRLHNDGGLSFVSHLEERLDWNLDRLTGSEIYNTHADLMDEPRFLKMFNDPLALVQLIPALRQFPQETFAAIQDYPTDYLRTWDSWCQRAPHTGVAANDAHHNQAYRGIVSEDRKLKVEDALGEQIALVDPEKVLPVKLLIGNAKPGTKVLEIDLDPYDRSFRHVSTHLLMNEITRDAVWDALQNGRAYVAFDWMSDPTGFAYVVEHTEQEESKQSPMGSQVSWVPNMTLRAEAALPVDWKLLRDGEVVSESSGKRIGFDVDQPGVYRIEAWLSFLGEPRPWILSNPIYIRPAT
jgi:hypothetical protein